MVSVFGLWVMHILCADEVGQQGALFARLPAPVQKVARELRLAQRSEWGQVITRHLGDRSGQGGSGVFYNYWLFPQGRVKQYPFSGGPEPWFEFESGEGYALAQTRTRLGASMASPLQLTMPIAEDGW